MAISCVIPTLNEEENVSLLTKRIHEAFSSCGIDYEIIFVDDNSSDNTVQEIEKLFGKYPIILHKKQGTPGKAYSLLEGFQRARNELICMIDGDLQYPPEAIPSMIGKINEGADVVIAERNEREIRFSRKLLSKGFRIIFARLLHGLSYDVQSGLKVFKKEVLSNMRLDPSPWTFDLDFILQAKNAGCTIESYPIDFTKRINGKEKVHFVKTSYEIGKGAIKTKLKDLDIAVFPDNVQKQKGYGFYYRGKEYVPHSRLSPKESALYSLTAIQKLILLIGVGVIGISLLINWYITVVSIISVITLLYFLDLLFSVFLITRGFSYNAEIAVSESEIQELQDKDLPTYTIFCPLYKESEVISQFVNAIDQLDYPKDKLQVLLLLEEDDTETIQKAYSLSLPTHFEIIVVPDSKPKTKPKACNYGLHFAKGTYCVIYDAEDIPERTQLKKVVIAFTKADKTIGCIQAKLNFYNPGQNILTRLFTAEYSLWFELILTGLQAIHAPIPLGGTSNHFRTNFLKSIDGWDAFNVTEDCDLGMRLAKRGYETAMIDSITLEEANSNYKNWLNQRTRWIKGYIQTYFVHIRNIKPFIKSNHKMHFPAFQIIVGGKVFSMFINPIMWIITISYFLFRESLGKVIESMYLSPILYMGVVSLILGNFIYFYNYMIGCAKRRRYDLVKYAFLIPFYWLMMSVAAWIALYRLIKNPYHWSKTKHGFHLQNKKVAIQNVSSPNLTPRISEGGIVMSYENI